MTAGIRIVPNAILRPSQQGEKRGIRQKCGVFDASGRPVTEATVSARIGKLSLPCACPDPAELSRRPGRWLYGGIGFHHFGHALIFSTARLWALDHLEHAPDGLVFFDRGAGQKTRSGTTRHLESQLGALGIDLPVLTVAQPEIVEELIVPVQGISTQDALFSGTPEYRKFVRGIIAQKPTVHPRHKRVYISRTRLGFHKTGMMFEDRLEKYLEQEGYLVFHPQEHSLDDQIAFYKGASHIIGIDGSAIHLAAFAANEGAKVAVLARRAGWAEALAAQVSAFSGAQAYSITAYCTVYAPQSSLKDGTLWLKTLCETQFPDLGDQLAQHGFINAGAAWKTPPVDRINRRLARAAKRTKEPYVAISETLRKSEPGA